MLFWKIYYNMKVVRSFRGNAEMAKFANTVSERTVGSQEEVAKWIWCDYETGPSEMTN